MSLHKKLLVALILGLLATAVAVTGAFASISTPPGNVAVIGAPSSVAVGALKSNTTIFAFNEQHGVTLATDLTIDIANVGTYVAGSFPATTVIAAGTKVDSHYVHFDPSTIKNLTGTVSFSRPILGVMVRAGTQNAAD